jgi:hypothetical protein
MITEAFREAHPEVLDGAQIIHPADASAVGGDVAFFVSRVPQIQIGPFVIHEPVASFPSNASGIYADPKLAGTIGAELLSRFDVTFDYAGGHMFLLQNNQFKKRFEYDMSGLRFKVNPPDYHHLIVTGVMKDSPASEADVQSGDVVLSVNGISTRALTLSQVESMLRIPDSDCDLLIERKGKQIHLRLNLRRLI